MSVDLRGVLDLGGTLEFAPRLLVGGAEALVVLPAPGSPSHATAPPVLEPPPPAKPLDEGPEVWVTTGPNTTVRAGARAIVAGGQVRQGFRATWPGRVESSRRNRDVRIGGTAISVVGDTALIEKSGVTVVFTASGQG